MPQRHHFISYSTADAQEFAYRLHDALEGGSPPIPAWLDKRDLIAGRDWDSQIRDAIRDCETLLFVLTPDSMTDNSVCHDEWALALKYKKPIIPLHLDPKAEAPFRLQNRQQIDCTGAFESGIAALREVLRWMATPEGQLQAVRDRHKDAQRDLRRARDETERKRIQAELEQLAQDIQRRERELTHPAEAARKTEARIEAGLERERQPERPVSGRAHGKFINPPPATAPTYFQDRYIETQQIARFLQDEAQRLLTVVGRGGNGKTALACRLLKALESGQLPNDLGEMAVDGIVYLSGSAEPHALSTRNLIAGLGKLLPADEAGQLDALYRDPQATTEAKLRAPQHAVKVLLTTRVRPHALLLCEPGRQAQIELDAGLVAPHAENLLREMDRDGRLGLHALAEDDPLLHEARERTCGFPRALEALYGILSADRSTSLAEMLGDLRRREAADGAAKLLPENVVEVMVGEAFNRLDPPAQQVLQALAIYGRPVPAVAVDFLLQLFQPGIDSAPVLNRLVNLHFARKDAGRFYLHPVDQAYALGLIPPGELSGQQQAFRRVYARYGMTPPEPEAPPYTQLALRERAADYFRTTRKPRTDWKTLDDLAPQLAEFELRCAAGDYDTAADVLNSITFNYLLLWGYARLTAELHGRLQGKLSDRRQQSISLNNLGLAYSDLGEVRRAIGCYEQKLIIDRESGDRQAEGAALGNLGLAYSDLGEVRRAIEYYEQALAIDREIGDRRGEGADLGNLGNAYSNLGEVRRAIEYYEQALAIDREIGDRRGEGADLGNLGLCYASLGQLDKALEHGQQALAIAREIQRPTGASINLRSIAEIHVDRDQWAEAVAACQEALQLADGIGFVQTQSEARYTLALAHLYAGDLSAARATIEAARQYDFPTNNHNVLALLGVIALRQDDRGAACEAFTAAVAHADSLLAHTAENYGALDTKGLALAGLALCAGPQHLSAASAAYRAARQIFAGAGIVARVVRLLDALAAADTAGILGEVRRAARGE
ncbi:MAG: tetratricopeptide repeat protein [Chloroflexi bacterium]|nr:tetratricopeptide repeat protein [Chloroflexota bacterium]